MSCERLSGAGVVQGARMGGSVIRTSFRGLNGLQMLHISHRRFVLAREDAPEWGRTLCVKLERLLGAGVVRGARIARGRGDETWKARVRKERRRASTVRKVRSNPWDKGADSWSARNGRAFVLRAREGRRDEDETWRIPTRKKRPGIVQTTPNGRAHPRRPP